MSLTSVPREPIPQGREDPGADTWAHWKVVEHDAEFLEIVDPFRHWHVLAVPDDALCNVPPQCGTGRGIHAAWSGRKDWDVQGEAGP